jgi:hypothetical protein
MVFNFWSRRPHTSISVVWGVFFPPEPSYGQQASPIYRDFRFLVLVLVSCLSWERQIWQLRTNCQRLFNILHVLTGASWGAGIMTIFRLYRCLIRL